MKTSGVFRVGAFDVAAQINKPIRLVIFGDVHRDSPNHAHGAWQEFLSYAKGLNNALYIGLGDYVDSASTSERLCLLRSDFHESTSKNLEKLAKSAVKVIAKELSFTKGKLIGLLNGNHYYEFSEGINSDQMLCQELECAYLGVSAFVRLSFLMSGNKRLAFDIWAHHGTGAGRLLGGSINRVDQMREHAEADCYIMGHDHKRGVIPATPRLYLEPCKEGLRVRQRQQWLVRSGSFLASYEDGESNYNVDAGRGPCSLGHVELELTPRRVQSDGKDEISLQVKGIA